jgi:hypothetical protein
MAWVISSGGRFNGIAGQGKVTATGGGLHQPPPFIGADFARNRPAMLLEAGEVPQVGEVATLLWLDRLDAAILAIEEDAFAIGFVEQREAAAVGGQAGELLDEICFRHLKVTGETRDLGGLQPDLSRPAATGRAALAFMKDGHGGVI